MSEKTIKYAIICNIITTFSVKITDNEQQRMLILFNTGQIYQNFQLFLHRHDNFFKFKIISSLLSQEY